MKDTLDTRQTPLPSNHVVDVDTDDQPKIRIGSHGGSGFARGELHMNIHGFDSKELELMEGAMHGHHWVTFKDGRLKHVPTYDSLPGPTEDVMMLPFWRRPETGVETQLSLFSFEPLPDLTSPGITIGSLCGYNYSAENYKHQAHKLQRWGFVCLRSQRDSSGKYYEHWSLPGLWAAEEELKIAIEALDAFVLQRNTTEDYLRDFLAPPKKRQEPKTEAAKNKRKLQVAIDFLCHNAQFGTLDVTIQRAAMCISD
jgi:hypothetical protein